MRSTNNTENLENDDSLDNWSFDSKDVLTGDAIKKTKTTQTSDTINQIMDDDEDDGETTKLDDKDTKKGKEGKGGKVGSKNKSQANEEDDEDEDNADVTFFEHDEDKKKPVKKIEKKVVKKVEDDEDDNEEEEETEDIEDDVNDKNKKKVEGKTGDKNKGQKGEKEAVGEEEEGAQIDDEEFYTELASQMKEKGYLSKYAPKKGVKLTEDDFVDEFNNELEARLDEGFEGFFKEMDEDGKQFLQFKRAGGDTRVFLNQYGATFDVETFDENSAVIVDKVVDFYLKKYEKLDTEDLEDRKKYIDESGKKKTQALKFFNIIKKDDDARKQNILEAQVAAQEKREGEIKELNEGIKGILTTSDKIGDFSINKVEQKELYNSLVRATVKVGKDKYIPEFYAKLNEITKAKSKENKKKLILLAKLVRDDFKLPESVEADTKTKVIKEARNKLQRAKQGIKPSSSALNGKRSLAGYFDGGEEE